MTASRRRGWQSCAILGKILYWLVVLVISLALLVGLVLFFESRDDSTLDRGGAPDSAMPA